MALPVTAGIFDRISRVHALCVGYCALESVSLYSSVWLTASSSPDFLHTQKEQRNRKLCWFCLFGLKLSMPHAQTEMIIINLNMQILFCRVESNRQTDRVRVRNGQWSSGIVSKRSNAYDFILRPRSPNR